MAHSTSLCSCKRSTSPDGMTPYKGHSRTQDSGCLYQKQISHATRFRPICNAQIFLDVWPEVWSATQGLATQSYKKLASPLPKLTAASSPLLGVGCCAPCLSMLVFGSALASTGLMVTATATIQLSWCVQRTLFPWRHPPPSAPILFLSLLQESLNRRRKVSVPMFHHTTVFLLIFFY